VGNHWHEAAEALAQFNQTLTQHVAEQRELFAGLRGAIEALKSLCAKYSPLKKHLYSDDGKLRNFVNVYVNDEDIRYMQKESTPLSEKDVLSIIPSIAGGTA
jgi:adenylyltransferase/sulfurtransferase